VNPRQRIDQQPAYILHSYPWRETSLIVETFSRDHGRVALVAKGARRPTSALRSVLMAFQPLLLDWSGGGEVKTLVRAEWQGGQPLLNGKMLLCGYYLNELLLRLSAREDPHPQIFDAYTRALAELSALPAAPAPVLRRFELVLLNELGYGVGLHSEAQSGQPLEPDRKYVYIIEQGLVLLPEQEHAPFENACVMSGRALLDMAQDRFDRPETAAQSRELLRMLINHYLGGQPLQSRRVLKELQGL